MRPTSNAKRIAAALERIAEALENPQAILDLFMPVLRAAAQPAETPSIFDVISGPCPLCRATGITTAPDNPVRVYCNCQLGRDLKRADENRTSFGYGT